MPRRVARSPRLILWGYHPAYAPVPIKLSEWSHKEQDRRTAGGFLCAAYAEGDAPTGLALQVAGLASDRATPSSLED